MRDSRYIVVLGACLTQFTVIGLLFSYSLFLSAFEDALGWSRTALSAASACAFLTMGLLAIAGGRLNDMFGPRRLLGFTGIVYGIGFALLSQVTELWQLFAISILCMGLGLGTHDVVTLSTVARWFDKRRGVMSGVVKLGTAAGQMAVPPIAGLLILSAGWRPALLILGLVAAVLLFVAAQLMRPPPAPAASGNAGAAGVSFAEARAQRLFWVICALQFLFFPSLMTVPFHLGIHGQDLGMSVPASATLLSLVGFASVIGRLVVGALSDRVGAANTYRICFVCLLIGLGGLIGTTDPRLLYLVLLPYGFAHGGLFVVVSPSIAGVFGMRAHGAIFGTVLFFGTLGGAFGPILGGWAFDTWGSYQPAFVTLAALAVVALMLTFLIPAKPR